VYAKNNVMKGTGAFPLCVIVRLSALASEMSAPHWGGFHLYRGKVSGLNLTSVSDSSTIPEPFQKSCGGRSQRSARKRRRARDSEDGLPKIININ
jgi:hypothetical protein